MCWLCPKTANALPAWGWGEHLQVASRLPDANAGSPSRAARAHGRLAGSRTRWGKRATLCSGEFCSACPHTRTSHKFMASPAAAETPALLDGQFLRQVRSAFLAAGALAVASAVLDVAVLASAPAHAVSLSGGAPLLMLHSRMVHVIPAPERQEYEQAFSALVKLLFGMQACLGGLGLVFAGSRYILSRNSVLHDAKDARTAGSWLPAARRGADRDPQLDRVPTPKRPGTSPQPLFRMLDRSWSRSVAWPTTGGGLSPQLRVVEVLSLAVCGLVLGLLLLLPTIYLIRQNGTVLVHTAVPAACFDAGSPSPEDAAFDPACADPDIRFVLIAPHVVHFSASGATFAMLAGALRPGASFSWACPYLILLCTLVGSTRLFLRTMPATDAVVNAIGGAIALFVLSLVGRACWQAPGEGHPVATDAAATATPPTPTATSSRSPADIRAELQRERAVAVLATRHSFLRALSTTAPLQLAVLIFCNLSCSVDRRDVWTYQPANQAAFYLITSVFGATYLTCSLWLRLRLYSSELRARLIRIARDEEELNSWEDHRCECWPLDPLPSPAITILTPSLSSAVLLYLCHETRLPMGTLNAALAETRLRLHGAASSMRGEMESAQRRAPHRASRLADFATTVQDLVAEAESQCATVDGAAASVRAAMRRSLHAQGPADLDPTRDTISLKALSAVLERTTARIAASRGVRLAFERRGALGTPVGVRGVSSPAHALGPVLCDETKVLELIGILVYNAVRHSTPPAGVSVSVSARAMRPTGRVALSPHSRHRHHRRASGHPHSITLPGPPTDVSARRPAPSVDVELLCEVEDQGEGLSPETLRHVAAMGVISGPPTPEALAPSPTTSRGQRKATPLTQAPKAGTRGATRAPARTSRTQRAAFCLRGPPSTQR